MIQGRTKMATIFSSENTSIPLRLHLRYPTEQCSCQSRSRKPTGVHFITVTALRIPHRAMLVSIQVTKANRCSLYSYREKSINLESPPVTRHFQLNHYSPYYFRNIFFPIQDTTSTVPSVRTTRLAKASPSFGEKEYVFSLLKREFSSACPPFSLHAKDLLSTTPIKSIEENPTFEKMALDSPFIRRKPDTSLSPLNKRRSSAPSPSPKADVSPHIKREPSHPATDAPTTPRGQNRKLSFPPLRDSAPTRVPRNSPDIFPPWRPFVSKSEGAFNGKLRIWKGPLLSYNNYEQDLAREWSKRLRRVAKSTKVSRRTKGAKKNPVR
jgi:hypothetical protein